VFGRVTVGSETMLPADNIFHWAPWASAAADFCIEYPQNSLLSDLILENFAWKKFISSNISTGQIPLWNSNNFAGSPFLASGQHSAYYPFSILFLILPLAKAYGWYTVSQLWLAGVLAYFFARVLRQRRSSAAVSGLIFQGSGFLLVSSAVFPMIIGAAVWLPLLLACIEMIIRNASNPSKAGRTLPWAVLGSVTLGVQLLAGHIEITYYTLLIMAFFSVWRLATRFYHSRRSLDKNPLDARSGPQDNHSSAWTLTLLKPSLWLVGFVVIGLMLGAVQIIPFVEVGQANFREGSASLSEIRGWAFPPRRALTLALPDMFGNPADHDFRDVFSGEIVPFTTNYSGQLNPHGPYTSNWGIKNYVEGGIYLGILSLFLAVLGLWSAVRQRTDRRSEIGFFTTLSLFSLSFIFGTPTYALLYYGLPGINQLHSPFRWVFPLSLCVAVMAGYGMDFVIRAARERQSHDPNQGWRTPGEIIRSLFTLGAKVSATTIAAGVAFWGGILLLVTLLYSRQAYSSLEPVIERLFLGLIQATDAFPDTRAFFSYQFEQILILALMLVASGLILRAAYSKANIRGRSLWMPLALIVIGLDLFIAGYGFNAAVDPALLDYKPEITQWLEDQPGLWRLTTFTPHGDKPLNANTPWLSGLQDIRGYDSIILKQYTDYMATIEPQNELPFNRVQPIVNWQSLNSPLLDLLGVKFIISAEEIELPKLKPVWQGEGLIVYENLASVPRAYTISQSATAVVENALEAMKLQDPRQFVFVEQDDLADPIDGSGRAQNLAPAEIVEYGDIEVRVRANVPEESWLILNDTYFTGWDAFIRQTDTQDEETNQEQQTDIVRVNGNFRGVKLEPGNWEVRFRYSPISFKLGGLISFMSVIIIAFSLVVWIWRRLINPQATLTNTRSIAKNSIAPMTLNLFNRAIDFVFAAFYLRMLGPADAGKYATAIIIAGWFEIVSNWGLNTLIIRDVSKDKSQASRYILNTSILRLGTTIVASLPIFAYIYITSSTGNPLDVQTTAAILLLMIGMIFSGVSQGLAGLFYAYEVAEFPAAITTITTMCKVGFGVAVLLLGYGFVGLAGVSILVNIITLIILLVASSRQFHLSGPWRVDLGLQRRMLSLSYPLMLNHLFAVIFFQIDVPLMKQINGDEVVGWYNSAYKWVLAFNVIPSFFTIALFPVISRQVHSSLTDARRTFRMSIKIMLLIAFPLAAIVTLLAPIMIGILGGRQFLPHGAIALQIVIWSIPIGWMNSVTNYMLISLNREKMLTRAFIIGVGFNLIANLIFLPRYSYVAASIITILSEIVLLLLFAFYLRPVMPRVGWFNLLKRPLVITAAMIVAIVLGNQVSMILALALGLLVYPLGLWLLRVFGEQERQIIASLLPENLAGRFGLDKTTNGE
jgi:O-antigen/teichoic acid export membrane protein